MSSLDTLTERGVNSLEKDEQDARESKTLPAMYASSEHIPPSATEPSPLPGDTVFEAPKTMLPGSELESLFMAPPTLSVQDLLGQLAETTAIAQPAVPMAIDPPVATAPLDIVPDSALLQKLLSTWQTTQTATGATAGGSNVEFGIPQPAPFSSGQTQPPAQSDAWAAWAQQQQQASASSSTPPQPAAANAWTSFPGEQRQEEQQPQQSGWAAGRGFSGRGGRGRGGAANRGGRRTPCRFFMNGKYVWLSSLSSCAEADLCSVAADSATTATSCMSAIKQTFALSRRGLQYK